MEQELLKVEHLSAAYGGIHALYDISLKVDAGEIVAVLGANGAGKSTLLKCLSSEKKAAGGTITFDGKPLPPKPYQVVEEGMVIVPEGRQIFYKLSVKENLKIGCCLRKDADGIRTDFERIYAMFPRLKERESQYGGLLSGGEPADACNCTRTDGTAEAFDARRTKSWAGADHCESDYGYLKGSKSGWHSDSSD